MNMYTLLLAGLCVQSCPSLRDATAPLSMEFPRQEYWSGLPFPSPEDLDPGIKPVSTASSGRFFATKPPLFSMSVANYFPLSTNFPLYEYINCLSV